MASTIRSWTLGEARLCDELPSRTASCAHLGLVQGSRPQFRTKPFAMTAFDIVGGLAAIVV